MALLAVSLLATGCPRRHKGQTEFVSADPTDARETSDLALLELDEEERSVEEGDIYRVLPDGQILNLNAYRGLQVIDVGDPENPQIVGRLRVSGTPVELYAHGDRAFVLLNYWTGYHAAHRGVELEARTGGLVLSVDLSDPSEPSITGRAHVPGTIRTSRLARGGGQAALYVVTGGWDWWEDDAGSRIWESRTIVVSFDVSTGALEKRDSLSLGGYVSDVQATPEALLVARYGSSNTGGRSRVSIIDIGDPAGSMVEGAEVPVAGTIRNQFNMDLYKGVLRVVSAGAWPNRTNYLETFDASNIHQVSPIDRVTFGDNETLFATLFVGNKAFFVTYFRIDPFHAFFIDDDGFATQMSEFRVSGWNDFFRAVLEDTRLIGIGVDDQNGPSLAVSLYDVTDLTNPNPLVARVAVETKGAWSEARWDHRAFSVLEDAVEATGPGGVIETGLVLLPFSGWDEDRETYSAAVQIFTFSADTLTRRGSMVHGTPVRRSFLADEGTTANLSELELSLFDVTDSDDPVELGRVELAPNYPRFFVFGDYGARVKDSTEYHASWWGTRSDLPPGSVEVVPRAEHPDTAQPVAHFEIPANATAYQVGDLLVTVDMKVVDASNWPFTYESDIAVWDLRDPTSPSLAGTLTTDRLRPSYGFGPLPLLEPCLGCEVVSIVPIPFPRSFGGDVVSVDGALVFLQRHDERELVGIERICTIAPSEPHRCWGAEGWEPDCSYESGSITCQSLEGAEPYCTGALTRCRVDVDGEHSCAPVDPTEIPTHESCVDRTRYRYWQRFALDVLDVTTPTAPALADPVKLPHEDEGVGMLADGTDVWISSKRPHDQLADSRPHARYFVREIDLSVPSFPQVEKPINVPGELLAVRGGTIFTRDFVWGDEIIETAIARLRLSDGRAFLRARRVFPNQLVDSIALDGAGHVLVSHRSFWDPRVWSPIHGDESLQRLSVLAAYSDDLSVLAEVEVASWARLRDARAGRALFQVPGGLLVFNLDDPTQPYPQAFFATRGWPHDILVDSGQILVAAGRFGIYAFELDEFNLPPPEL